MIKIESKINILVSMIHLYRFSVIVIIVLIAVALCWFGLRAYGIGRTKSMYQTPLVETLKGEEVSLWSKDLSQPQENGFYYSNLYFLNNQWMAGDVQNQHIPLKDLLQKNSKTFFLFYVDLSETGQLALLKQTIDDGKHWQRVIFTSAKDGVVSEMRKLSPQWSFANGEIFLTRYLSLATLGLESLMDITSDVILIRPSVVNGHPEVKTLINNALKQNKYILIGPTSRPLQDLPVNGWLLE